MTPVFSFRDIYKKLNNPEYTIWVLYWIGAVKYNKIEKTYTVNVHFLPKMFSKRIAKSPLDWKEIRRHTKSFNAPVDILPDLVIGQGYALDGEFHENAYKKSGHKELEFDIDNPSILAIKRYHQINDEYKPDYKFPIDLEFYGNQPFIEFRSQAPQRIVLFPCFELARYFFFTAKYITREIITSNLFEGDKMNIVDGISVDENGKRNCVVALTNRFKDKK